MKRKFTYDDLDLLQTLDLKDFDDWELDAELLVGPLTEQDLRDGRPALRLAHFGLGFCLGERPEYVFWFPSMAVILSALGVAENIEFDCWDFPHPPIEIIGAPREFLTLDLMAQIEGWRDFYHERWRTCSATATHSWGADGPRHGHYYMQTIRRNAAGELVEGPRYYWKWTRDRSKAPFTGVSGIGMDGLRAEDLGLWAGPGNPSTLRIREVDGVQVVYPRTDEFFAKFRPRVVKVEDDLVVAVGKRLKRWGAWEDPVLLGVGTADQLVEEFGGDSDGGLLWWFADGEDLAEVGVVEAWLGDMVTSLGTCGVSLVVKTVSYPTVDTPEYTVRINGEVVELYRTKKKDPLQPIGRDPWMACTMKPLTVVNKLLADAGSVFRLGVVDPGGNDGIAFLLPISYWQRLLKSEVFVHAAVKFPGIKKLGNGSRLEGIALPQAQTLQT